MATASPAFQQWGDGTASMAYNTNPLFKGTSFGLHLPLQFRWSCPAHPWLCSAGWACLGQASQQCQLCTGLLCAFKESGLHLNRKPGSECGGVEGRQCYRKCCCPSLSLFPVQPWQSWGIPGNSTHWEPHSWADSILTSLQGHFLNHLVNRGNA